MQSSPAWPESLSPSPASWCSTCSGNAAAHAVETHVRNASSLRGERASRSNTRTARAPARGTVAAILRFVRWVVEFVLQVFGWTMLAIGGGSLYLLVTTGSAPAIGSTPAAIAVVLGSAALIWVTRRSLYKKQYRGY